MREGHFASCTIEIGGCLCGIKRSFLILGITGFILVVEIAGGIYSGSLALLSDAGHVAGDFLAITTAIIVEWLAYKNSARESGARVAGAYIHGLLLFLVAVFVLIEAYDRFHGEHHIKTGVMFVVAVFGAIGNLIQHKVAHKGERTITRTGMLKHIVSDLIQSIAVIVSAPLIWLTGSELIDPIVSILIAGWIVKSGVELLVLGRETGHNH